MKYNELYTRNTAPDFWDNDDNVSNCNCGSFALNLTSWFAPYLYDGAGKDFGEEDERFFLEDREWLMCDMLTNGCDKYEIMDCITERDWEFILKACPWLEPIRYEQISDDDRVIAYRLMFDDYGGSSCFDPEEDTDFHFRVLIDGKWWEKNGSGPIHLCEIDEDIEEPWKCGEWVYDGCIKYARFKEAV